MTTIYKTGFFLVALIFLLSFGNKHFQKSETNNILLGAPPKIGEIAPEINLPSVDRSVNYKLSDLRGKLVLINFWTSMNAPCSYENLNQVNTYNKYKDKNFANAKGFTIYSVSLDSNLENWKKAIAKDKLSWPYQVCDLKGRASEVVATYGVTSIPYNYLIDGNGVVLAINLRGAKLGRTIAEYLK